MLTFQNPEYSKESVLEQLQTRTLDGEHPEYEACFGIPILVAKLGYAIFEGLPRDIADQWPLRFIESIETGTDLSLVGWKFLHWTLTDREINPSINHRLVKTAIRKCAKVLEPLATGKIIGKATVKDVTDTAGYHWAAVSLSYAARIKANYDTSCTEIAAWYAAESAKHALFSTSWDIEVAEIDKAYCAAEKASSKAATSARYEAPSSYSTTHHGLLKASYIRIADKLIELIKAASNQGGA
jgi:hypothetical protein